MNNKWTARRKLSLDIAIHNEIVHTSDKSNQEELKVIRELVKAIPEANANLIAAAPLMHGQLKTGIEALYEAISCIKDEDINGATAYISGVIAGSQIAYAKAEGKQ